MGLRGRRAALERLAWGQCDDSGGDELMSAEGLLCAECGRRFGVAEGGAEGAPGTLYSGHWYCDACWQAWRDERPQVYGTGGGRLDADRKTMQSFGMPSAQLGPPPEAAFVPIVSLGSWCGVKAACRGMGISSPTLPFDWVRLALRGVLDALEHDFEGFLSYDGVSFHDFAHPNGEVFFAQGRSFWHDDLRLAEIHEKYGRRVRRFRDLIQTVKARSVPVIFVRAVATTFELFDVDKLLECVMRISEPSPVWLLLLLDAQHKSGTILIRDRPNVLIGTVSRHIDANVEYSVTQPPYVSAYHNALRAMLALASRGLEPPSASHVLSMTTLLEARNGFIRHVSLQEDLKEPWSHDPHQPPEELLQGMLKGPDSPEKRILAEMMQAHVEALYG